MMKKTEGRKSRWTVPLKVQLKVLNYFKEKKLSSLHVTQYTITHVVTQTK